MALKRPIMNGLVVTFIGIHALKVTLPETLLPTPLEP